MIYSFRLLTFWTFALLSVFAGVDAEEFRIAPDTDLQPLLKRATAGDSFVLRDGVWLDAELTFDQMRGTVDAPIRIFAETPGKVILSGRTQFRFSGQHVIVSGFVVRNPIGVSDVLQLRTHSKRLAHHCRVTDCRFEESADATSSEESHWLSIYGTNNRIDHCYFGGKKNRGTTLVVWVTETPGHHQLDHNHFGPRPVLGKNGGETIRIGSSEVSEFDSGTLVEQNYFHACDGEAEIISNKSCANTYRHNVFEECSGALTLRHGHRCLVDSNLFLGRKKNGTGGVRIIGQSHTVTNNYFEGLRGDAERAALCMMNGIPDSPLNGYAPVRNASVLHNTFVDCKVSIEIGVGDSRKQSVAPAECRISHNIFLPDKWEVARMHCELTGIDCHDNKQQIGGRQKTSAFATERIDLLFARTTDGLLRPTASSPIRAGSESGVREDIDGFPRGQDSACGCDEPGNPLRRWPDKSNTGPSWMTGKQ